MRKVNLKIAATVCALIMTLTGPAEADTWHVDPNGSADFTTIQAAINAASTDDWIEVAPGTYTEAINFSGKAVRLYSRDGADVTTIDGTGNYHVVQCVSGENANTVLEGFTITGGNANGFYPDYMGGGMYNFNYSSPTVRGCTFSGNSADLGGGGMCNYNNSNPTVTGCTFSNNTGGGMKNFSSSPTVTNCIFSNNTSSGNGGGMYNQSSSLTLTNCTFSGNSTSMNGGGIYNFQSSPTVTNCILWGNTPDEIYNSTSTPIVTYSDVEGGYGGTGNIDADPLFLNAAVGDFRLTSSGSPCVDTGNNSAVTEANDLAGNPRVVDGDCDSSAIVDMGVFELQPGIHNTTQNKCYVSIQIAIDDSNNGDQIEVGPGTYYEAIDFKGKAVRLYGRDGADVTTIDGTGNYHVVQCVSGEDANTILEGFTITGGDANGGSFPGNVGGGMYNSNSSPTVINCVFKFNSADVDGGGMYNNYSSPTVKDCNFTWNSATEGGGMYNNYSSPKVTNCTFSGNSAVHYGGGMYNDGSSPTVTGCTFNGNSASSFGGGMSNYEYSSPTVTNCTFSGNTVEGSGGGMCNRDSSNTTVTNCTFSGNSAGTSGGGMFNWDSSSPTVRGCTFSGNTAHDFGGGMFNWDSSSPTVTDCTFTGNSTSMNGGGMYNYNSIPTVTNCTFSGNSARTYGGGMLNLNSNPKVTNCILWGNTAPTGPQIYSFSGSSPIVTYSDIQGGYTGTGNIDADANFVDANNPDPNLVDLRLMPVSPCIDAADSTALLPIPYSAIDLDGNIRFIDSPSVTNTGSGPFEFLDMGAYEYPCNRSEGDINCDGVVNFKDFAIMAENWLVGAEP